MRIWEKSDFNIEELKHQHNTLANAFPNLVWHNWSSHNNGVITSYQGQWSNSNRAISAFYHHGIAVLGKRLKDPEIAADKLQSLGYHVASEKMNYHRLSDRALTSDVSVLWDELRSGKGKKDIMNNLQSLLTPILTGTDLPKSFEFAVYDPFLVTSTDDVIPPYVEYDELIELAPATNGMVDIDRLVEIIATMPSERALAISSRLETSGGERHIPMVDFITNREEGINYEDVTSVLRKLGVPYDFVVDSGNSFHHHDPSRQLSQSAFYDYLDTIAKQPDVGPNWPFFSAHQGFSLLRISPSSLKPSYPTIFTEED